MNNTAKRKKIKHLNFFELELIERMLKERKTISEISIILGRSNSSISKELRKGIVKLLNSDLTYRYSYSSSYSQVLREDLKSKK